MKDDKEKDTKHEHPDNPSKPDPDGPTPLDEPTDPPPDDESDGEVPTPGKGG